jgi:hypothetical protein
MFDKLGSAANASLALVLGWTFVGCGVTGLTWVDEPEPASAWAGSQPYSLGSTPASRASSATIPARTEAAAARENHPRLNHTVTLGEVYVAAPEEEHATSPFGPPVSVTINNYGPPGAAVPIYSGYYSGFVGFAGAGSRLPPSEGAVIRASRSAPSSMQPGQNWPAVFDHGSSFPYRSAPASPWSGDASGPRR